MEQGNSKEKRGKARLNIPVKKLQDIKRNMLEDVLKVADDLDDNYIKCRKELLTVKDYEYSYYAGYADGIMAAAKILEERLRKVKDDYAL